jgi:hypothetical protein
MSAVVRTEGVNKRQGKDQKEVMILHASQPVFGEDHKVAQIHLAILVQVGDIADRVQIVSAENKDVVSARSFRPRGRAFTANLRRSWSVRTSRFLPSLW